MGHHQHNTKRLFTTSTLKELTTKFELPETSSVASAQQQSPVFNLDMGLKTSLSGEERSFMMLPLPPTHFTDGKVSPGPRSHSYNESVVAQEKRQLSCLPAQPWLQPGPILSFYIPGGLLEQQPRICGDRPTQKPAGEVTISGRKGHI